MKKNISKIIASMLLVFAFAFGFGIVTMTPALAVEGDTTFDSLSEGASAARAEDNAGSLFGEQGVFKIITNTALFLIGAVSVVMLIYGGVRYTVSGGDSTAVGNAKNTILYAIVGIVVSILAYAAVSFVIGQLDKDSAPTTAIVKTIV